MANRLRNNRFRGTINLTSVQASFIRDQAFQLDCSEAEIWRKLVDAEIRRYNAAYHVERTYHQSQTEIQRKDLHCG